MNRHVSDRRLTQPTRARNRLGKGPAELTYSRIGWPAGAPLLALVLRRRIRVIVSEKMQRDHEGDDQHREQSELNHGV